MHKINFEMLKDVETGTIISGFFGDKKQTKERWIAIEAEIVTGSADCIVISLKSGDYGFIDLTSNRPDEDGVITVGYQDASSDWFDIRNVKISRG